MADLNLEQLDRLVGAYLYVRGAEKQRPTSAAEELRGLLLSREFGAAAGRLRQVCPALAENQWLQFQLKKLEFMHLAALAKPPQDQAGKLREALDLAKRELAPLALHAYCEAFADFKTCMATLLSGGSASDSDSASGASASASGRSSSADSDELRRLAGMVARAVRQQVGCDDPRLTQLLRYLLLLHQHQQQTGFHPSWWPDLSRTALQLSAALLLPVRDAQPSSALEPVADGGGLAAGGMREHDVQALRTSLGCDREEAVLLLRQARGDAFKGLQDALQAAHINDGLLQELTEEYAAHRGLELAVQHAAEEQQAAWGPGGDAAMQVDEERLQQQQEQHQEQYQQQEREHTQRPCKQLKQGTGNGSQQATAMAQGAPAEGQQGGLQLPAELSQPQLQQALRQIEALLAAGQAGKAIQLVDAADRSLLPDHPAAAFALHRCRFLEHLLAPAASGGGAAAALAVVRQHLSPLAQQHPSLLQPQLKATLAALLPLPGARADASSGEGSGELQQHKLRQHGIADALTALREALRPRCHVREPRLQALLRELLTLHSAHFKLQRCQDRFAADIGIQALKAPAAGSAGAGAAPALAAAAPRHRSQPQPQQGGDAQGMQVEAAVRWIVEHAQDDDSLSESESELDDGEGGDGGGGAHMEIAGDDDEDEVGVPEQAILTVCEFTGLPRHTAIELLLVHGGDAAAVLAHVFP